MRRLQEAIQQVEDFARKNDHIRGLVYQGSLVMKNGKIDRFTDVDPAFYVDDVGYFLNDESWIKQFGTPIARFSDVGQNSDGMTWYTRLLLLKDGFKMDISFHHVNNAKYINEDPLYKVIIDKDGIFPKNTSRESNFYVKEPTEQQFHDKLNEFFFDTSYVIKSLRRNELFFTRFMYGVLNEKIEALLSWYMGIKHDFKVNIGAKGRYFFDLLDSKVKSMVIDTFAGKTYTDNLEALYAYFDLVHYLGAYIEEHLGLSYLHHTEKAMRKYIDQVKDIPLKLDEEIAL
ncbi:MAG: aminoglycoside 6-adenylyltransferase [Candidatus Izemoplasma sp.]|nr:aminoglycoside 6-adenylyltransferase [Candidatus Izemoplasma sp.]